MTRNDQTELTREELRAEFKGAAEEAIDESDFATREDLKKYVSQRLAKVDEVPEEVDPDEEETADSVRDEDDDLLDVLEAEGVPDDLIEAVGEYVEKADEAPHVDPYLEKLNEDNAEHLNRRLYRQELENGVRASAAAATADNDVVNALLYEDEEGA